MLSRKKLLDATAAEWDLPMANALVNSAGASLAVTLFLYLWRTLYPATDWAVVALAPLAALLFMGSLWTSAAVYRASMKAAVRGNSPLTWLMTGRVRAFFGATIFTLIAVPLLAWHAISSTYPEFLLVAFLCFIASMLFAGIEHKLLDHLTPPFARVTALSLAMLIAALFFVPVLAWADWNFTPQPSAIRSAGLGEALELGFRELPARRGWMAELLAPFYALEYGKLWVVVQPRSPKWFSFWYSIDAALISFVAGRASAVLMSIVQPMRGEFDEPKPKF